MTKGDIELQLSSLEAFLASPAFRLFQVNVLADIQDHNNSILALRPRTMEEVSDLAVVFGQREITIRFQTYFEELRDRLKTELLNLQESDNIIAPQET